MEKQAWKLTIQKTLITGKLENTVPNVQSENVTNPHYVYTDTQSPDISYVKIE